MDDAKLISIKELLANEFEGFLIQQKVYDVYIAETIKHQSKLPGFLKETFNISKYLTGDTMPDAFAFRFTPQGYSYWHAQYIRWMTLRRNILIKLN